MQRNTQDIKKTHLELYMEDATTVRGMKLLSRRLESCTHDPLGYEVPYCSTRVALALGELLGHMRHMNVQIALPWVTAQAFKFQPIWSLEEATAEALYKTALPFDHFPEFPHLPFPGIYVAMPPLFELYNEDSGLHKVEGFYLAEDEVFIPEEGRWKRSILVLGTGESKGDFHHPVLGVSRDDALVFFHVIDGRPFDKVKNAEHQGIPELLHVVVNMLWALHTRHLKQDKTRPKIPRSAKKRAKRRRRGYTEKPYTVIRLQSPTQASQGQAAIRQYHGSKLTRQIPVSGYWQRRWVKDPGEEVVLAEKQGSDKRNPGILHQVSRWIHAHVKGPDDGNRVSSRVKVTN
jgi:hypothetical protein